MMTLVEKTPKRPEATARAENLGAIYYVETDAAPTAPGAGADVKRVKWAPPVRSDEVTLLREDSVVGFSALDTQVSCCCGGQVFAVGEDEDWGFGRPTPADKWICRWSAEEEM